ncbi:MAG TPA: hypothetical protein VI078_16270 [bacterium]
MRSNAYAVRREAHVERQREESAAGLMSDRFPGVSSIVVTMNYKGDRLSSLVRTVNFFAGSPAYFRISCLGEGCERGALDLTWVIHRMIRGRERSAKGELGCENRDPAVHHANVDYGVTITYR